MQTSLEFDPDPAARPGVWLPLAVPESERLAAVRAEIELERTERARLLALADYWTPRNANQAHEARRLSALQDGIIAELEAWVARLEMGGS